MEHTQDCSRRYSEAEEATCIALFNPDCPRCKLNYAAPDLLAVCEKLVEYASLLWGDDPEGHPRIMDKIEAAIAKARK